jgi:hypothetical protein
VELTGHADHHLVVVSYSTARRSSVYLRTGEPEPAGSSRRVKKIKDSDRVAALSR